MTDSFDDAVDAVHNWFVAYETRWVRLPRRVYLSPQEFRAVLSAHGGPFLGIAARNDYGHLCGAKIHIAQTHVARAIRAWDLG